MKQRRRKAAALAILMALLCGVHVRAAGAEGLRPQDIPETLPFYPQAESYLESLPLSPEEAAAAPQELLRFLLPDAPAQLLREETRQYTDLFLFLILVLLVRFLTGEKNAALLELAAAGGCSLLLWQNILLLTQRMCDKLSEWRTFLMGFLPVYASVLAAGGETAGAASVGGTLLAMLCGLAQLLCESGTVLLRCYLALSAACSICSQEMLSRACRAMGRLLRQGMTLAGKAFAALLGLQRVFTAGADRAALRVGRLVCSTIPLVGQALSGSAETVLAGMQLFKGAVGFAGAFLLAAEFIPFYLRLLAQGFVLWCTALVCGAAGLRRCEALLTCLCEAIRAMAAATALFFGMTVLGTALMFLTGGG